MTENFPLFVDSRVGSIELVKHLKMPCEVTTLRFADVTFCGYGPDDEIWSIGIERKGIRDLANSIISGRLSGHQLVGLLDYYHVVYVVVDGEWRVHNNMLEVAEGRRWKPLSSKIHKDHTFGYTEISNYLNTLAVVTGVKIWFTKSIELTGEWIRHTYHWWQKPYNQHKAHLNFVMPPPRPKAMRLSRPTLVQLWAKELDGVGWERAEEISKVLHTPEDLMNATPKDLVKIPQIGPTLAERIYRQIHRK